MIKKVSGDNLPTDIDMLLIDKQMKEVAIGNGAYELRPLPASQYFMLTEVLSKYYHIYNDVMEKMQKDSTNIAVYEFITTLIADPRVLELLKGLLDKLFPEIKEDCDLITVPQLKYLLGVIYQQNFLEQIRNPQTKSMIQEMQRTLGLNLTR